MNCKPIRFIATRAALLLGIALLALRCNESLPAYVFPQNVLSLNVTDVEENWDRTAPIFNQQIRIRLEGENTYDEVFQDTLDVKGTMRIWWVRFPDIFRTIVLSEKDIKERELIHNGKLTLLPGQKFTMDIYWDLLTDSGMYVADKFNFTKIYLRECLPNIACSDPEQFVVETSLNVFDRLGYLKAEPKAFYVVAHTCISFEEAPCH